MVIPEPLFDAVNKIQDTNLICPPAVSQAVALAALRVGRDYCAPMVRELADVRHMVLRELHGLGESCDVPDVQGAFYCLARVRTSLPVLTLVERLIREHRVAVIPGNAFGLEGPVVRVSVRRAGPHVGRGGNRAAGPGDSAVSGVTYRRREDLRRCPPIAYRYFVPWAAAHEGRRTRDELRPPPTGCPLAL